MLELRIDNNQITDSVGIGNYRLNNRDVTILFEAYWGKVEHKGNKEVIEEEGLYFSIKSVYDKVTNRSYNSSRFTRKYIPMIREISHEMRLENVLGKRWI